MLKILAVAAFAALGVVGAARTLGAMDAQMREPQMREPQLRPASDEPDTAQAASLTETPPARASGGAASISRSADGHYWAEGQVNGRRVRFLVDTGATTVALTLADAERLGIRPLRADYVHPVMTANGETRAAQVKLDSISVSGARVYDVDAMVVEKGLTTSLLGMTYLGRLSRFEATPTALILRP
jgi:aspartyl protease family protein